MTDQEQIAALQEALKLAMEYWLSWDEGHAEEYSSPGMKARPVTIADWRKCNEQLPPEMRFET